MKLALSRVHFIGVGGIGMSGLAELLQRMGAQVSGSDLKDNQQTQYLSSLGVKIYKSHQSENVMGCDVVVYSSAIRSDNPEIVEAQRLKIPQIPRAEALAEIMRLRRGIAVGGTHGKTTTTSMLSAIFLAAQQNPTIAVGGRLELIQSTARLGEGEWMIAEADESDGSFSRLNPEIAVITNIDNDHLDYYGSMEAVQKAFYDFALKVPFYGVVVACGDDLRIREIFKQFPKKILLYGFSDDVDFKIQGEKSKYKVLNRHNECIGDFSLKVPGHHNALNALGASVAAHQAGLSWEKCFSGLGHYSGVDRRFHYRGEIAGVSVYDDYGHHPTEIKATLQAFREKFSMQKIHVLFQPHRYSRTQLCWSDFLNSFNDANQVFLLDIYPAGEKPIDGIHSQKLAESLKHPSVKYVGGLVSAKKEILSQMQKGDILVCLGAGDINKFYELS